MGKDSKHQRTKGGIQPSSASRTAELLEKTGAAGQPLSFLAAAAEVRQEFSTFTSTVLPTVGTGSPVHGILANVLIDDELPPEVRLIFRKLQKKDATTKIKALVELSQSCDQSEGSTIPANDDSNSHETTSSVKISAQDLSKSVLPQWCKCFPKLTVDDSRKVRELTHSTHAVICKAVGRNLAPFLKQLVPHWYLAKFDIYGPVASAAKDSYSAVFPNTAKQSEVLKFCSAEIIAHLSNNLDTVFRVKKAGLEKGQGKKQKKGNKASKEGDGDVEETAQEAVQTQSKGTDSESYEARTCYSTLTSVANLIQIQLATDEFLEFVFGDDGAFWDGAEYHKDIVIKRSCFDLLSTFLSSLGQNGSSETFSIPAGRCSKLMNAALTATQKEILPNVWNAFLTLTLKGLLKDGHLAQRQLLTCCKNGFYGNASQIGPSVLPLLARIWEGFPEAQEGKKREFAVELIEGFVKGYESERSNYEKAAILRTFAETIAFLMKNEVCNVEKTHEFIIKHLKAVTSEFPKLIGTFVKDSSFYEELNEKAIKSNSLNTKEYGEFVVGLVSQPVSLFQDATPVVRKAVKFRDPSDSSNSGTTIPTFDSLPEHKRLFLQNFVKTCVEHNAFTALSIISRQFPHKDIWTMVNLATLDFSKEESNLTRLRLALDLLQLSPENPQILSLFSNQFELFKDSSNLQLFVKELQNFTKLQPVKKWIRMGVFTDVVETCLKTGQLSEMGLSTILKFVFSDIYPESFIITICSILCTRMDKEEKFFEDLARLLSYSTFQADLSSVYGKFWEYLLRKSVEGEESTALELSETVCVRNREKLSTGFLMEKLENQLEACETVKQVDLMVSLCRKLDFVDDDIELAVKSRPLSIKPDVLVFIGQTSRDLANDTLDQVPKFSKHHRAIILKSIFYGRFVQNKENDSTDLVPAAVNVLYAQAVGRIWTEIEKSEYIEPLAEELLQELDMISSRLIETICADPNCRKIFRKEVDRAIDSPDPIWNCKLPVRILLEYCKKSEIKFDLPPKPPLGQSVESGLNGETSTILNDFSFNKINRETNINWITEKRQSCSDDFEFETIFYHAKNKSLIHKLLQITYQLLERIEDDDEEFMSTGTCWIEAWLKHTKNLEASSKSHLLWISKLARAVGVIGERVRTQATAFPKFAQEYVEFHCAQIYPVIYSLYNQLNNDVSSHSFWSLQALYYVSGALSTMPGTTLAFIEPDSIKLCDIFSNILGNGVSASTRIAAYKALRKVKYDMGDAKDLPIVPPGIDDNIRKLIGRLHVAQNEDKEKILYADDDITIKYLVSYLLTWDALLKVQKSSNEFASYVRDQDHLLTPFLNTLFFSESIPLENASTKYFDSDPDIVPGTKINILHLSCSVLQRALRNLPYTVRWWWNNHVTKQRDRVFVEKFVVKHLSSKLAAEELGGVKLREGIDDNVTVQCHTGCNELQAHYRIEETNVTLTISLPLNHPLGPVTVKISDKKLHAKISQLLNTRSHSLSAGLKLWKENLDGLYKDVDECAICFFILHHVNKQTPKLACKTCRKKFHGACLYKWFSTSNKSECPLCRNLF